MKTQVKKSVAKTSHVPTGNKVAINKAATISTGARTEKTVKVVKKSVSGKPSIQTKTPIQAKTVSHTVSKKKSAASLVKRGAKRRAKIMVKSMLLSKSFHKVFNIAMVTLLVSCVTYVTYAGINSTIKDDVVVSKSEIVDRVTKLTILPNEALDDIVRVQDPEELKKQNSFYANVKEGDYILMYPTMAIIYDLRNNVIVSEKKIEKQPNY